jgi:hypothetical protein
MKTIKPESFKKILFLGGFTILAFLAYQINFSQIMGSENASFTFFQFLGPIGAGLFTPVFGAASVLAVEAMNFVFQGTTPDAFSIARLFPMVFAAFYFGSKTKKTALVPLACMALFVLHPVGQQSWLYSLYWLVPVAGVLVFKDNLFVKSLGTTFTAHAVGSVAFLYAFGMTPEFWLALIPLVFVERVLFALGISVSFVAANTVIHKAGVEVLNVDAKYVLSKEKFRRVVLAPVKSIK